MKSCTTAQSLPNRRTNPIISSLPLRFAASRMASASATFMAMGFSHSTWRPASSAAIVQGAWAAFQVQTLTASSSSFATMSFTSVYSRVTPCRSPFSFSRSSLMSQNAANSTRGSAL